MQVDMENLLEDHFTVGQEEIDSFTAKTGQPQGPPESVPHLPDPYSQIVRQIHQSFRMRPRNNEHVPRGYEAQIHKRDDLVVLMNDARIHTPPRDRTENTSVIRQPDLLRLTDTPCPAHQTKPVPRR